MQIANFTNSYLPVINGVVRSVNSFRKALTEMGHNVFIFAQGDDFQDEEPFIFRYPSLSLPIQVDIPAAIPISPNIDWLLPYLKLDVIHTHHPVLLGQTAAMKSQKLEIPLVFTFHTQYHEYTHYVPFPQETIQVFLKEAVHEWMKIYMRKCTHIVVPSQSMLEIVRSTYGLENQYTVIPTGIALDGYQNDSGMALRKQHGWENDLVMISVGRLAKEKNWAFFLEAAQKSLRQHPQLRIVLLGDGPDRKSLKSHAEELGIADRVDFLGDIPFEQVPAYLQAADFFGFASTTETQGLVTLEALAAGLPVVAVDAAGTRDIIQDGVQGLLVPEDRDAFSQAIHRLIASPEQFATFQQAARKRAAEFEIHKMADRLIGVYTQAKEDHQAGRFVRVHEDEIKPPRLPKI
ncbi:glycosyltransferase [bacterium]|nr:glycosyltransferase [bacterium]